MSRYYDRKTLSKEATRVRIFTSSSESQVVHSKVRRWASRFRSFSSVLASQVEEKFCKFAKKGLTPSQISVILRDSHGIAQVKSVTGSKILHVLKAHGLAPKIPEDLYHLIKKAVSIRKHLERNRKDKDSKFRLILVESRIHRLARYYKKTKKLPPIWK
ncbi:small ribosomal subunit protein uS15-like [Humulus lupulus]|uniref:small ribosomal subunit protein uS15-like n=1 Tax=Humulus lupulus TaxID=3486 RepID=UPI002B40EDAD|nr:small ribosomal subunit protein uS15-like [Humulus lupulus]